MQNLAMIVAASDNNVIGNDGDLPWRLSADLKRFKKLTMGHHIIMGRKTFESIGRLLPGRVSVIVTRNPNFRISDLEPMPEQSVVDPGAGGGLAVPTGYKVSTSIGAAIEACTGDEYPFVTGGAEIYRQSLSFVTEIHLTRVHLEIEGDTYLPEIDWSQWTLVNEHSYPRDPKNEADYSFQVYRRVATV